MKKFFIFIALIALSLSIYGCGGGSGSANLPGGENPGLPSVVQLMPSHYIAQTNVCITLNVKVLDGNGAPVKATPVTFTNLSHPLGELRHACNPGSDIVNTPINTDNSGIARAYILSNTPGFATILAQVYTGAGQVRDRATVFFTTQDILRVRMDMDIDSEPSSFPPNQLSDYTLFENANDDTVKITATVRDAGGLAVGGGWSVLWSRSHEEAKWVRTDPGTNVYGQAEAIVKVEPASIRNTETHVNIMAFAGNGAANMVTLFLRPVVPDPTTSYLTANPTVVEPNKTSKITAVVMLNTGSRAPDGTVVNFSVMPKTAGDPTPCGVVTPFSQTTNGVVAEATFTAPAIPGTCTVTGKVAGVTIGTVDILVTTALTVIPPEITINGTAGGTAVFTIFGGIPAYTIVSSDSALLPNPASVSASGGTFSVTVPAGTPAKTVTYTVRDKAGTTVTAKLTITAAGGGAALTISPSTATVASGGTINFVIVGGTAPYTVTSSHPAIAYDSAVGDGSWTVSTSGGSFLVNTLAGLTASNTVTLTVVDSASNIVTATLTINPPIGGGGGFALTPKSITLTGLPEPNTADDIVFRITGGTAPYTMFSNNNAVIPSQGAVGATFTVDPEAITADTKVIITVVDSTGATVTSEVTVTPVSPAIAVNPSKIDMTAGDSASFYILGGTGGPLTITSGSSNVTLTGCALSNVTTLNCPAGTTQFIVNAVSPIGPPGVLITVIDETGGTSATSSVVVNP